MVHSHILEPLELSSQFIVYGPKLQIKGISIFTAHKPSFQKPIKSAEKGRPLWSNEEQILRCILKNKLLMLLMLGQKNVKQMRKITHCYS